MRSIRWRNTLFPVLLFMSLTLFLSCGQYSDEGFTANKGVIDLSGQNTPLKAIPLSGEWEFYWMKFIDPMSQNLPLPAYIHVPGTWNGFTLGGTTLPGTGFASYRITIITKEKGLIGFSIPDISGAYKFWINGELIASAGTPGTSLRGSVPSTQKRVAYCYSDGRPLIAIFHVSNFQHTKGGIWKPIMIGSSTVIHTNAGRSFSALMLVTGGLTVIGLSFFVFYLFRKDEKQLLLLSLLCFTSALQSHFIGNPTSGIQEQILPWEASIRMKYITPLILLPLFIYYMNGILYGCVTPRTSKIAKIISLTSLILALFTIITPSLIITSAVPVYALFISLSVLLPAYLLKKAVSLKQRESVILTASFLILCIAIIHDLADNFLQLAQSEISPYALLFFAIIQSILVSFKYSHAFHDVELLSRQLKANNTMIKKLNEQIEHKNKEMSQRLYTDRLTGLPNRQSLFVDIHATSFPSLMLIDIDDFKEVNDFYGNRIGDYVLKEAALNLGKYINTDIARLYKLSVDEYAILLDDESLDRKALGFMANSLCQEINRRPIIHGKNEIYIRITVGAALGSKTKTDQTYEDIIVRADLALKQAKRSAKHFLIYDDTMEIIKEYEKNMHWARKLKMAVETNRIIPYYQPIINTTTGAIEKFECLVRLNDDDGSIISPIVFLDIAKKCRLYTEITKIMLEKAFEAFKKSSCDFSINISMDDILDAETREFIIGVLQMNPDTAQRAIFEILESQEVENYSEVGDFISRVKSFGCRIAVDDFGSGYSNFGHIMSLNIDFIKIDSSLIKNIHVDRNSRVIVKTISVFAKELGIKTVAEFVHCQEVFDAIKEIGIDYAQGYHLGKPTGSIDI
jgi:diguanylate cyclase (GGDEF)-like protein